MSWARLSNVSSSSSASEISNARQLCAVGSPSWCRPPHLSFGYICDRLEPQWQMTFWLGRAPSAAYQNKLVQDIPTISARCRKAGRTAVDTSSLEPCQKTVTYASVGSPLQGAANGAKSFRPIQTPRQCGNIRRKDDGSQCKKAPLAQPPNFKGRTSMLII